EDVATRSLRGRADDVDRSPERVADDRLLTGTPRQVGVEPELEAGETLVVDAGVAEHLRRDRVLRVEPALLGVEAETGETSTLQRGRPVRLGLPLHVDEALLLVHELRID